jgi:RNA polymerase sigma factor (sigma-70 family)
MAALDAPPPAFPPAMLAAMDDGTLAGLVAAGSDEAFAALDERYRRRLVRFTRGFVAATADAEDAVQDAMVRAVRALRTGGSQPEAVGPWLHRIARNCALDVTAARRRHPVIELTDHLHPVSEDVECAVERRLGVHRLVADVGGLPDSQRSALVLRELEGRSYADIADELDTTIPAVKSLLVRARTGLKRAREQRRAAAAAWLPLPLLQRLAERVSSIWEPVTATAAPKVACAAVVVAGSLPVLGPATGVTHRHHHRHAVAQPTTQIAHATAARTTAAAVSRAPARARKAPPLAAAATGAVTAPASAQPHLSPAVALQQDCADGVVDGSYPGAMLRRALSGDSSGSEYADCAQALQQALLKR